MRLARLYLLVRGGWPWKTIKCEIGQTLPFSERWVALEVYKV